MQYPTVRTTRTLIYLALLLGLGLACAARTKAPDPALAAIDITGTWKTNVKTPQGDELEVFLNISKSAEGALTATMDVPDMGAYDFPITFSYENGVVHYAIEQVGADFNGKLTDPSTIEGEAGSGTGDSERVTFQRIED